MQWNCEALSAKIDELKHLLKQHKIDRQPNFPGYAVNRVDRSQKRGNEKNRGRGVMIGVRDTLAYRFTDQKLRIKNIYYYISSTNTKLIPSQHQKTEIYLTEAINK